jgi:uncharacterized protein (TIGR02611 family)
MARPREVVSWAGRSTKRIVVTVVGFTLVALGIVLLVVPGPGILVLAAGLAVLATEYAWARKMLDSAKRRAAALRARARGRSGTQSV